MTARWRTREEMSTAAQSQKPILGHIFEGHEKDIWNFVFLHDNDHIVSGSEDGTMCKWNCNTGRGRLVGSPWKGKGGSIYALALSPDGETIACGRKDGSVQRWNVHGEMINSVRTGQSASYGQGVRSLSWSPSGIHIASGSEDGTILIQEAESGKVEVGPIETKQDRVWHHPQNGMHALAYSPSGDRIATGGYATICIWNAKTGQLVIRPINDLGDFVSSLVWSSDSTKLYSASDKFARVFDSSTGTLLYHFQHGVHLFSVALSPQNDILACVGIEGIVQLWDTVSCRSLALPFGQVQDRATLYCVSFSRDGTYLAYSGENRLTLWMVEDMALRLAAPVHSHRQTLQQKTRSESLSSSCLDADATGGHDIIEEARDDPYDTFFQSSQPSLSFASSVPPRLHPARRFWNTISLHHPPENKSVPLQDRLKRKFFAHRARSHSPQPATTTPKQPTPDGTGRAGEEDKDSAQTPLPNDPIRELDDKQNSKLWRLLQARAKDPASADEAPAKKRDPSPRVVEVYAVRGFQGYVALTRKRKAKSLAATFAPATAAHPAQAGSSSQTVSVHAGPSSQGMAGHGTQYLHATGGPPQASPSYFVTSHNSDSRSSIEGSCNRFLDKICFPCGHFHDDS